jgi:predicted O-methyltransferase YrrM
MKNLLEIAASAGVQGFLHAEEFEKLIELAAGKNVLEVGSFMGLSAYGMAWTARNVQCVDTFRANTAGQFQMDTLTTLAAFDAAVARFTNVKRFIGSSAEAATSVDVHGQFDFVFLDAMHTYEDVKSDIERWWPRVRNGGTMAFHDYGHHDFPGVKQAVDERFGPLSQVVITLGWLQK